MTVGKTIIHTWETHSHLLAREDSSKQGPSTTGKGPMHAAGQAASTAQAWADMTDSEEEGALNFFPTFPHPARPQHGEALADPR